MNTFESFRKDIVAAIEDVCVKTSKSGDVSYFWGFREVCEDVARITGQKNPLPDELKSIVQFEFSKLKNSVFNERGQYEDLKTRFAYKLAQGSVVHSRTTEARHTNLSLERQIEGARILLDKCGKSIAKAKTGEQASNARKRERTILKELNMLLSEQDAQEKVKQEAFTLLQKMTVENNVESLPGGVSVGCQS